MLRTAEAGFTRREESEMDLEGSAECGVYTGSKKNTQSCPKTRYGNNH